MKHAYRRNYRGPIQAVVLDWAGTTLDYGCIAPVVAFVKVFRQQGVDITQSEARGPMGMRKSDHIREITRMTRVQSVWRDTHGRPPDETDVHRMYEQFTPMQTAIVADYAALIPGVSDAMNYFRCRAIKVGSCTGYTRTIMDSLVPVAAELGYRPDSIVAGDEVPAGRPAPWMALQSAMQMNVYPMASIVKIGDTVSDIQEGLNAGMWTIGLAKTGNEIGLNEADVDALETTELESRLEQARERLEQAGAHFVVEGIGDTPPVIEEIERQLRGM